MDGGVLDNAPFGPVLDEITRRPVHGPSDEYVNSSRYVLYVVPSSGGTGPTPATDGAQPGWKGALSAALRYPSEADLRGDVDELEQLLLEADASWSDTQRLQDTCVTDPAEADRVRRAAAELEPAYIRARAAGGVWEAITRASPTGTTVLDVAAPISAQDVTEILDAQPLWLPPPGTPPVQPLLGAPGARIWPWGTGPAERMLRLMLRSHRVPGAPVPADVADDLVTIDKALELVVALRDALGDALAAATLPPPAERRAYTAGINEVFTRLDLPAQLGAAIEPVAAARPDELRTALAVEIVARCTAARTPPQRSAPFTFLRLGPDVALPVLAGTAAQAPATELGDRILYGTQVNHFGAFGAVGWRRWDWLLGRLHGAAHLGRLLKAGDDWIRQTQLAILAAEGSSLPAFVSGVGTMAGDFPSGPGGRGQALVTMRDQLNATPEASRRCSVSVTGWSTSRPGCPTRSACGPRPCCSASGTRAAPSTAGRAGSPSRPGWCSGSGWCAARRRPGRRGRGRWPAGSSACSRSSPWGWWSAQCSPPARSRWCWPSSVAPSWRSPRSCSPCAPGSTAAGDSWRPGSVGPCRRCRRSDQPSSRRSRVRGARSR
jgi:hypothetical protein